MFSTENATFSTAPVSITSREVASMRAVALYTTLSACILGFLILFTYSQLRIETVHPFSLPQSTVLQSANKSSVHVPVYRHEEVGYLPLSSGWVFDYKRDARNHGLSEEPCLAAFSKMYKEIDRAADYRRKMGRISRSRK